MPQENAPGTILHTTRPQFSDIFLRRHQWKHLEVYVIIRRDNIINDTGSFSDNLVHTILRFLLNNARLDYNILKKLTDQRVFLFLWRW